MIGSHAPARRLAGPALVLVVAMSAVGCGGGDAPDLGSDASGPTSETSSGAAAPADAGGSTTEAPPTSGEADDAGDVEVTSGLPEGWPDDLPIPDDAELTLGQRTDQGEGSVLLTADFRVEDGGANVYTAFLEALQDGGATILQRSSGGTEGGFVGSISFTDDGYTGNVAVDETGGSTLLSVSVVVED